MILLAVDSHLAFPAFLNNSSPAVMSAGTSFAYQLMLNSKALRSTLHHDSSKPFQFLEGLFNSVPYTFVRLALPFLRATMAARITYIEMPSQCLARQLRLFAEMDFTRILARRLSCVDSIKPQRSPPAASQQSPDRFRRRSIWGSCLLMNSSKLSHTPSTHIRAASP